MIRSFINGIRKYFYALDKLSNETGVSKWYLYPDCIWSWLKYGCVLNHYTEGVFYRRKSFERKDILTYRRWEKILLFNNKEFEHLLSNKLDFCGYFKDYIGRDYLSSQEMSVGEFRSFLQKYGRVFVKPVDGQEGRGIRVVANSSDEQMILLYQELKSGNYILEEPVTQHPDMVFGNKSVNTIRVYTTFDRKVNKAFCIATTLRAGVGDSIVDNSHAGGLSYEIDIPTGRIDSRAWGHRDGGGIFHPGTEICMLGREIPFWKEVLGLCETAAALIPQVPFIGWDVAITPEGPVLIEGNHDPDLDVMEFVGKYGYYKTIMNHLS